jgi:hypothetical protein
MNCIEFSDYDVKLPFTDRAVVENCINQMENCASKLIHGSGFGHKL